MVSPAGLLSSRGRWMTVGDSTWVGWGVPWVPNPILSLSSGEIPLPLTRTRRAPIPRGWDLALFPTPQ